MTVWEAGECRGNLRKNTGGKDTGGKETAGVTGQKW